ncbi:hypothetical protein [Snodgrassella alvi]|uniref:hypothetical protein n=1 Tax=Snodgrassella alvi TaxID=1196083 RepID=UPI001553C0FD|nr:hypothetical protein [Snodgrassella alvi]
MQAGVDRGFVEAYSSPSSLMTRHETNEQFKVERSRKQRSLTEQITDKCECQEASH